METHDYIDARTRNGIHKKIIVELRWMRNLAALVHTVAGTVV